MTEKLGQIIRLTYNFKHPYFYLTFILYDVLIKF